jgi:hypothetical protein
MSEPESEPVPEAVPGAETDAVGQSPTAQIPDPPETGDPEVDRAIGDLAGAMGGPLEEQLVVYEAAHRTLQDRLADVEG